MDELLDIYKSRLPESPVNGPRFIQDVMDCIHQHLFDQRLTMRWLREYCWLDNVNFTVSFKFYVGDTPRSYWTGHRLEAAKMLLKDKSLSETAVGDVAFNVGYGSHAAFTIAFKKYSGCSPKVFRDRHSLTRRRHRENRREQEAESLKGMGIESP